MNSKLHLQLASSTSKYSVHMRKATWAEQTKVPHRVADCSAAITIIIMSLFEPVHRAALQLQVACHPALLIHKQNLVSSHDLIVTTRTSSDEDVA